MHLIYIIILLIVECQAKQNNVHEKAILISFNAFCLWKWGMTSFLPICTESSHLVLLHNPELLYVVFVY
jgi:hypothetical protein